jgi:hypothetical protein
MALLAFSSLGLDETDFFVGEALGFFLKNLEIISASRFTAPLSCSLARIRGDCQWFF